MDRRHLGEIASIATELSSLHQERETLEQRIATLEGHLKSLIDQPNGNGATNGRSPIPAFLDGNRSLPSRIVLLLKSDPNCSFTPEMVQNWLPQSNLNSVRSALSRLAKTGHIEREDTGIYRARDDGY